MKKHVLIAVVLIGTLVSMQLVSTQSSSAQRGPGGSGAPGGSGGPNPSGKPVLGWAWSATEKGGPGYIKFDIPSNPVMVQTNGDITGYAWSSHIGYIKFGGLSNFPSGPGTTAADARINNGTGAVTGWARACKGTQSGDCTSMISRTDGWDGWISLSGTGYGVTMNTTNGVFSGFAWGADVVSWLSVNAGVSGVSCPTCGTSVALAATCSVYSRVDNANGTATVTFRATASGGRVPYEYKWATDDYSLTATTYTPSNFSQGTWPGPTLLVKDSGRTVVAPACPSVVVAPPPVTDGLRLFIGGLTGPLNNISSPFTNTGFTTHQAHQGDTFAMRWVNELGAGYQCDATAMTPSGPGSGIWPTWYSKTPAELGSTQNAVTLTTSATMPTGLHTFRISCTKGANPPQIDTVTLDLLSADEDEI